MKAKPSTMVNKYDQKVTRWNDDTFAFKQAHSGLDGRWDLAR